jgi:hypothetical protein
VAAMTAALPTRLPSLRFLAVAVLAPVALGVTRLLPAEGAGLALRLAAATACVLLVPGALVLRALGWPGGVGVAVAGSVSLSLVVALFALGLTFLAAGSLSLTLVVIVVVTLAAAVPAALAPAPSRDPADLLSAAAVAVAGAGLGAVVWWAAGPPTGDAMFHLARVRKLDDFGSLTSLSAIHEFRDGLLHPGYAFPLWHGVLAMIARLAGADPTAVVTYLNAILVPLAFVLAYAAGASLFRSWAGGVATATAEAALVGLQGRGIGALDALALPATMSARLLAFAFLALGFAYLRDGTISLLAALGASALALAVIHPTYAPFVALPFTGYLAVRLLLVSESRGEMRRMIAALAAIAAGPILFFAWLFPVVRNFSAVTPSHLVRAREIQHYRGYVVVMGDYLRLAPRALTRGGPATVAAFLAIPFAGLGGRRSWVAYVLGAALAVFPVLLIPYLFTPFSDVASLSQARRLAIFLPLPFALAGAFLLLGRLRWAGAAVVLALAFVLDRSFSREFGYQVRQGGPGWVVWFAFFGSIVALLIAVFFRRAGPSATPWTAAVAVAFAIPLAVSGLSDVKRGLPDPNALTPGLVHVLRTEVRPRDVVFGDPDIAFEVVTYAPVYIPAVPAWELNPKARNLYKRRLDATLFFSPSASDEERRRLLAKYGARWLVIDKTRPYPASFVRSLRRVYEDTRYALYRVGA